MILTAITTCRREPSMVERAVRSVIAQTYTDWNLVVVDDSPSDYPLRDDVRRMVEGYASRDERIRYVPHDKNYGAQRARNTALAIAIGSSTYGGGGHDFIAYLDDDDEWLPTKLEKQLARLNEADENTALVYCHEYIIDNIYNMFTKGLYYEHINYHMEGRLHDELLRTYNFIGSTSFPMMRTRCLQSIGGFDELMESVQDWDVWLRLAEHYEFVCVNEPLVNYYYRHGEHIGGSPLKSLHGTERLFEKNRNYIIADKSLHRLWLKGLIYGYMACREYKQAFNAWIAIVRLQPLKAFYDLLALAKHYAGVVLRNNFSRVYYAYKCIKLALKMKLKGAKVNWYQLESRH